MMPPVSKVPSLPAAPLTLLGLLLLAVVGGGRVGAAPVEPRAMPATAGPTRACSLSPAEERRALDAFDLMLPVLFHPRCLNCHGGVNPYLDPQVGRHLGGQMVDSVTGGPLPDATCQDCHGLLPGWTLPGEAMLFVDRSPTELCKQFKQFAPAGGSEFVEHIALEPGLPPFIPTAFLGHRALNALGEVTYEQQVGRPPTADQPPGSHADLVRLAQDWVTAVGRGWNQDPECGCAVGGSWHGTVTAHGTLLGAGMPGALAVSSTATVMLEPVTTPSWSSGNRVRNYHATGGVVTWHALATGRCRGTAGGTMPLDTVDIGGNPMAELRLEDLGGGVTGYQPTTGSWPDRWSPMFTVQCDMGGQTLALPMTNLLPTWWHYDVPNQITTASTDTLKGRHTWSPGPGSTILWEWTLARQR